ncbi:hypothetical protein ASPWEDRAFT_138454 [Aspergillus wentii DTO 134E9]|uniref:Rhodopsin domain-containing protein n=1 Tax=Aspergillus wentii DTO 134E9 TaxID=1073089 RepID=A0A1L9REY7_ASPWE|nr:uncharacterized protein ASPWEDRAFT_138454 [Aspergillus wentii DTO 134E9]KAI9926120.1 hypothetical protein MW887_004582 [Aspergillus wentii]OJJ33438.1 hypothetical protein ASPWEDRAFT_138454 [Aspergillus wentii DTO 134E9]
MTGQAPLVMGVVWVFTGFTAFIVMARMFIRSRILRNVGLDDWLIGISMIFGIIYAITTTISVSFGYGQHASTLSPDNVSNSLLWCYISFIFGILSFAIPKLAIAALLNRLFNPGYWNRIWLWFLTGLVAVVAGINIIVLFTQCTPKVAMWKTELILSGQAKCRDPWILVGYATFNGAFSGFADLYLAVYPSFVLWKLQLSLRKKVALSATLGFGAVACSIAIVKCVQLKSLADLSDPTTATVPLVIWTNVEANMVIIASCIPTLQPLLELIMGKRKLSSFARSNRYQQSTTQVNHSKQSNISKKKVSHKDAESQESVLRLPGADEGFYNIRRTDDVCIEYEMYSPTLVSPRDQSSFD